MNSLRHMLLIKRKVLASILFDTKMSSIIRNVSTVAVLSVLVYASYLFFHDVIFTYVINLEDIGYLLIDRLVSLGFFGFFFMLIISSFVTALATLYRSRETEYLFSTPLPDLILLASKYIDILIYSSWALLIMALPILHAYARVRQFGTLEYALTGLFVLLPFVITATAIGTILSLVMVLLSKYTSMKPLILLGIVLFVGFLYLIIQFSQTNQLTIPFTEDFRALNIFINNLSLNAHPYTPNFWLIQCLRSLVLHDYVDFTLYSFALVSSALLAFTSLLFIGKTMFFKTWLVSNERTLLAQVSAKGTYTAGGYLSRSHSGQGWALFSKDALLFLRDPGQWAQILLLLVLLSLYLFNLRLIPADLNNERWHTILFIMNFGFCGFTLATLGIRFIFPSISLEGSSFWIIGSSPLKMSTLFRVKFLTSFIVFVIIAEPIAFISGAILRFEGLYYLFTTLGIIIMSASLSCLAVGLGAAYPDFSERNPSKIATSPGGILTIVLSLLYIGTMVTLLAIPAYRHTVYLVSGGDFPHKEIILSLAGVVVLNAVVMTLPLLHGRRLLATREF
ncbi:hypothetical protein ACFL47_02965 [Candidatus Latescibacterota bacterium]